MVTKEIAKNYIAPSIWSSIEKKVVDYYEIEKQATAKLLLYIPCWDGSSDLMRNWACIFEEALIHNYSGSLLDSEVNLIGSRYHNAIQELKDLVVVPKV